jgi:hypothetical protein
MKTYDEKRKLHSFNDEPAVSYPDGTRVWYKHGVKDRAGGPALITPGGIYFYKNNKLHNADGPAVIKDGEPPQYWRDGVRYTEQGAVWPD